MKELLWGMFVVTTIVSAQVLAFNYWIQTALKQSKKD